MASSVPTLISNAQTYAASAIAGADAALSTGVAQIQNIGWTNLSFDGAELPTAPTLPEPLEAPVLQEITLEEAAEPDSSLIYQDISAIEAGSVPTFTATAPSITLPSPSPRSLRPTCRPSPPWPPSACRKLRPTCAAPWNPPTPAPPRRPWP